MNDPTRLAMATVGGGYSPVSGHYDEMMTPDGSIRPHWRGLLDTLAGYGPEELNRRAAEGRRMVHDNGATFHIHKEGREGTGRPWPLDLIPVVMEGDQWRRIEQAVVQRASLLNMILADLYGPQRLIRERLLPAQLLYAHPGFLRACWGCAPARGVWLHVYAADLARAPDGSWWFLGDRTETPMGSGYTLENRLVVHRGLDEAFDALGVRRLAPYFQTHKEALRGLAPGHHESPRIAVLTPGPESETYFEHAFLARYLGYTLVEGPDLMVRDGRVFLKTLGGLLPVDLILRRQESASCDPVEFAAAADSGTPGLADSVRTGNVAVANALGSGLAESPALMAFLPNLARHLLGEDLRIPSVATWWCGQEAAREHVRGALDRLVVKPAFPGERRERAFGRKLTAGERTALDRSILEQPYAYVGQEEVSLSTTPFGTEDGIEPRFLVLRTFAVSDGQSYTVMPGGLARVSASTDTLDASVECGGSSKDIWVLGGAEEPALTLLPRSPQPIDVSRATFELPSRVAENLFWLGRYAERVDAAARFIRATLPLLVEESSRRTSAAALDGALNFLTGLGYVGAFAGPDRGRDLGDILKEAIRQAVVQSDLRGSFGWQIRQLHRRAWLLRDRLSNDTWWIVNRLESDYAEGRTRAAEEHDLAELLDRVVVNLTGFGGAVVEGMTRGHGWRLLDIGRRLERALQVIELLRHGLVDVPDDERSRIELLLDAADSTITYRSRYLTSLQANLTIDLLLIDDANPRAVGFQLDRLMEHVDRLAESSSSHRRSSESPRIVDALSAIELAPLEQLATVEQGRRPGLARLLDRLNQDLSELSDDLTRSYLTHATLSRQLAKQ